MTEKNNLDIKKRLMEYNNLITLAQAIPKKGISENALVMLGYSKIELDKAVRSGYIKFENGLYYSNI